MKLLTILTALTLSPIVLAQDTANPNPTTTSGEEEKPYQDESANKNFWEATLPGGAYLVALSRITSISKHEYLLDGNLIITEVTIDTLGDTTLRVYQITPAAEYANLAAGRRIVERGKDLLDRAGQRTGIDLSSMVQKQYPMTTHSKTIEFRVKELGVLEALHESARKAWMDGEGRKFAITE